MVHRAPLLVIAALGQFVAACAPSSPEPRLVHLDDRLSVLVIGPISTIAGSVHRSAGFVHASIELRGPPDGHFNMIAHWRRMDGAGVHEGPTDQRQVMSGPAGIIALEFVSPSLDARDLLIEIAPSSGTGTAPSHF
jgi:hypothetical protein